VKKGELIQGKAREILEESPEGVRYMDLCRRVQKALPSSKWNAIRTEVFNLGQQSDGDVHKPSRGLFRLTKFRGKEEPASATPSAQPIKEEERFYRPFAEWLTEEVEDCTKAVPLGGNKFRDKWGTPDVIGKWESPPGHMVKGLTEIVSAEIKTDSSQLITAFGQACAYKIFSHKSYLVVPKASNQDDISRLDALCQIFGIGLVLFDNTNMDNPDFEIRVRPARHEPDMFYVNKYAKEVERELFN
jgi:hypothetical protein